MWESTWLLLQLQFAGLIGPAKVVPGASKWLPPEHPSYISNGRLKAKTLALFQAALRPLKKCTTKEITAIINRR